MCIRDSAQSDRMAERLSASAADTPARIELAFQIVFARRPTDTELSKSAAFVHEQAVGYAASQTSTDQAQRMALADFCHMLLSSNEFLYVE